MKYYLFLLLLLFQATTVFSDDDLLDTVVVTGTTIPVSISDFSDLGSHDNVINKKITVNRILYFLLISFKLIVVISRVIRLRPKLLVFVTIAMTN